MKFLTKSRFKLALECPNKLYYTRKNEYADQKKEDLFLEALAQGGFQVEELARLHYPEGILIESHEQEWNYQELWEKTQRLMEQDEVVIFEGAFQYENLYIKADILVKKENYIKLIEVKSKSYDPNDENFFVGKRGGIVSGWKPYLFDVAYQHYVLQKCFPGCRIDDYLFLADKSKRASIDGLNQLFRLQKKDQKTNRTGIDCLVEKLEETGESVLTRVNVSGIVQKILKGRYPCHESLVFEEAVQLFSKTHQKDEYLSWPVNFGTCKHCEFKTGPDDPPHLKSGYKECFTNQLDWKAADFSRPNIMEVWNFRGKCGNGIQCTAEGIWFMDQLQEEWFDHNGSGSGLSNRHRQWIQVEKAVSGDDSVWVDRDGLAEEMDRWEFPLHFIDFETSAVALPFHKGRHPYEQIAFQFSHHIYHEDGRIEHASEYLNTRSGEFPNFDFIRALKKALENDTGTIFRYADHENTILNKIREQLPDSNETDRDALISFIETITHSTGNSTQKWRGQRDMIDLRDIIKWYYYNPGTRGSNGMKAVLPAVLESSPLLQEKYSKTLAENGVGSLHMPSDHCWLRIENGKVISPYKMLPSPFTGWTEEQLQHNLSDIKEIEEGGAAMMAYAQLQFMDMTREEREEINRALLRYCELDTLAMVMVYEHFLELVG